MAITLIVGGQYGSEGKGSFAHWWGSRRQVKVWCRAGGSQAGHSVNLAGRVIKLRQLPVGALIRGTTSLIGPGAVVDPDLLSIEIDLVSEVLGEPPMVIVDPGATVLEHKKDAALEGMSGLVERLGSTGQGVGSARQRRIDRTAKTIGDLDQGRWTVMPPAAFLEEYRQNNRAEDVVIEGTQGAALSLFGPYYPFVTSQSTHPAQLVADMGFPLSENYKVMALYRTHPIRVGGNSGPLYKETDWETLQARHGDHIPVEETTVTGRTRRVGEWDRLLASWSVQYLRPSAMVLTFVDYPFPEVAGQTEGLLPRAVVEYIHDKEGQLGSISYIGTGFGTYLSKWEGGW